MESHQWALWMYWEKTGVSKTSERNGDSVRRILARETCYSFAQSTLVMAVVSSLQQTRPRRPTSTRSRDSRARRRT